VTAPIRWYKSRVGRRLVAAIALICFSGCASTATIARTDALDNEAEIEHSDADALYLLARNGQVHRIPRQSIRGIDHPGNVEMLIGAILLGLGAFTAYEEWNRNDHDDAALVTAVYGIPGLTLFLTGLFRYIPSRKAAWEFQFADRPATPPPPPGVWYPPPPPMLQQPPAPPQPPGPSAPLPVEPAPPPAEPPGPEVMPDAT